MKIIKILFIVIWALYCLYGIIHNYSHYDILDWIIIAGIISAPYVILWLIAHTKRKMAITLSKQNINHLNELNTAHSVSQQLPINQTDLDQKTIRYNNALAKMETSESSTMSAKPVSGVSYVEDDHIIARTDGKEISDEEIAYLMQVGFEETLERHNGYNGELLNVAFMQESDKNKKEYTKIPTYEELSAIKPSDCPIYSTDIFFLKYLDGLTLENPFIAQYWYYDYNMNYPIEIKKLIATGLLTLSNVNISKLKVDELKNILRHFNLPLTGKKADLYERICANINDEQLIAFLGNQTHYFKSTEAGKDLINITPESATKNLELEDACIEFNLNYEFDKALSLIESFKRGTPAGINYISPDNSSMKKQYQDLMDSDTFYYTLVKDYDIEQKIRAIVVFCRMYGCSQQNIIKAIKRIYLENNKVFSEDAYNILRGRLL